MNRTNQRAKSNRVLVEAVERRVLMSAGQLDTGYDLTGVDKITAPSGVPITSAIAVGADGRQVVSETFGPSATAPEYQDTTYLSRYSTDGTPDTTFGSGGTITLTGELVHKVLIRPAGGIIAIGTNIQQFTTAGAQDFTFASGGVPLPGEGVALVLQPNGQLLVSVADSSINAVPGIYRYNIDGSPDTTWGTNGLALASVLNEGIALDSSGRVLVSGGDRIARLTTAGALDPTFGTSGVYTFSTGQPAGFTTTNGLVAVAPDGSIDATATFSSSTSNGVGILMVASANGTTGTAIDLGSYGVIRGLAVQQATGDVVVVGASLTSSAAPNTTSLLSRFDPVTPASSTVTLDTTFNSTGTLVQDYATHIAAASDTTAIDDEPDGLALGPNGGVFFTGTSIDPGYPDNIFFIAKTQNEPSLVAGHGSITGRVFSDTNGDGIQQSDESSLPLYGAFLDNNNDGVFDIGDVRVVADAAGNYLFAGLTPGTYHVVEIPPTGYQHTNTSGDDYTVTVTANTAANGINFGLEQLSGTITGTIFDDINGDGVQQSNEPGLPGFGVYLDKNNNGVYDAGIDERVLSDASGQFNLSNLAPGTYYLRQNVPAGLTLTTPASLPQTITVTGNSITTVNFGEHPTLTKFTGTEIGTSGSYESIGNTIANVFDGNLSTFYDAPTGTGGYVGLDLGTAQVVTAVVYAPRPGFAFRMVGGIIQASNSPAFAAGTVTLATITTTPTAGVYTTLSFTNTTAYRYYRYLGPAGSFDNIAELAFYGPAVG